jgi:MFS family permease
MLADGVWRDGKNLVMNKDAALPARCVKCGEPVAALSLKRKLTWHSPWWYVLVLVNLLIYALVAVIISKRATIHVGLCDRHRGRRKLLMTSAWLVVATAIVMLFLAAGANANSGLWVALGVLGLLVSGILGVIASRVVMPKRITKERIWLAGIHPSILETLPEWDGGKE